MGEKLTILQSSQKLGCTKAAVRFHLAKLEPNMVSKNCQGIILISEEGVQKLKDLVKKENVYSHNTTSQNLSTVEVLTTQLDRKDKQIADLSAQLSRKDEQLTRKDAHISRKDEHIAELTRLLDQQQRLQAATQPKTPEALNDSEHPKGIKKWWKWF
jgi:predicted ArsR family transcriptional regulator